MIVPDANNPIGIDVAKDGKVYWSEIGNPISLTSTGYVKMYDPAGPAGNKATVLTIPTRADHGNSEDGVLGMALQPGFDLADPTKRNIFVYYSPRGTAADNWPTTGTAAVVGYNQISRFTLNAAGTEMVPDSERLILKVPKAKIVGSPAGFPGGPTTNGPGHVGGAGMDFDSAGNLYLGVGDDVAPGPSAHGGYTPMDHRSAERWDARKTSANSADLRGKVVRINADAGDHPRGRGVRRRFDVHDPRGQHVRPRHAEDPSRDLRDGLPAAVHPAHGPGEPGHPRCRRVLPRQLRQRRQPLSGRHVRVEPDQHARLPRLADVRGQQLDGEHVLPLELHDERDRPAVQLLAGLMPSDIRYAPPGGTPVEPTNDGLDTLPGPAVPATIWKKYPGAADGQSTADFGNLDAGGMQPVAGPIYRYDEALATPGAFPRYYDGSWLINNRGADSGFWKEVQMRKDNNQMLRVNDWLPYNSGATSAAQNASLVIGSQFGADGQLYLARFSVGCCRDGTSAANQTSIVKISFNVQDECLTDTSAPTTAHEVTGQAYPDTPGTYVNTAKLKLTATDSGCAGVKNIEYRVNGEADWHAYSSELTYDTAGTFNVEYRSTDKKDNVSAVKTATFTVLKINDTTAPTANATTSGNVDQRGYFVGSANLTITATDDEFGSGVHTIEYRVNGGAYNLYTQPVAFNAPGTYDIDYRATDKVANTSAPKTISFRILSGAGCSTSKSDEFDGTTLGSQWIRHTRNGGTPTEGALAPTLVRRAAEPADGELRARRQQHHDVGRPDQLRRDRPARHSAPTGRWRRSSPSSTTAAGRTSGWPCGRRTTTSSARR